MSPPGGDRLLADGRPAVPAVAIVLAAGAGERLGRGTPKGFVEAGGRTILGIATWAAAECPEVGSLVVAVPAGWEERALAELPRSKPVTVVAGGRSRHQSVELALQAVTADADVVLVHDSARCLATTGLFRRVLAALVDTGADGVVPVVAVSDTVKRVREGRVVATEPRDELGLAQTPQGFRASTLRAAHQRAEAEGLEFTDDAAALEWAGYSVLTIAGEPDNFKITAAEDVVRAEAVLSRAAARFRAAADPSVRPRG